MPLHVLGSVRGAVYERTACWSIVLGTENGGFLPRVEPHLHPLLASSMEHIAVKVRVRVLANFVRASYCS